MAAAEAQPLQLFEGGPLWRLLVSTRLVDPPRKLLLRRIIALIALTWLPLVLLSAVAGTAVGNRVEMPLIRDLGVYVRFLLAVPLLVLGEVLLHAAVGAVLRYLEMSGIVPPQEAPRLAAILAQGRRRRDSLVVELLLLAIAFGGAVLAFSSVHELFNGLSSWRMQPESDGSAALTRAGWWYAAISVPLFQFLVLRWLWRLAIWTGVLRAIARLDLGLVASHPDHAGGLGFVSIGQLGFAAFLFAINAVISASIANSVWYGGQTLSAERAIIIGAIVISLLLVITPLIVFRGALARAKRLGRLRYGVLASHHGRYFEKRWLTAEPPPESVLEAADISSLADIQAELRARGAHSPAADRAQRADAARDRVRAAVRAARADGDAALRDPEAAARRADLAARPPKAARSEAQPAKVALDQRAQASAASSAQAPLRRLVPAASGGAASVVLGADALRVGARRLLLEFALRRAAASPSAGWP